MSPLPPQATGYLSQDMFRDVLQKQLPSLRTNPVLVSRLYAVADRNNDGRIGYREFCLSASRLLRGSLQEKLGLLFQLYDFNKDGYISVEELIHLLKQQHTELEELISSAADLFVRQGVGAGGTGGGG